MKKFLIITFMLLFFSSTGWCYSIVGGPFNGTDVGDSLDTYLGSTSDNLGGFANEVAWANGVIDTDPDPVWYQVDKIDPATLYATGVSGVYAFNLPEPPVSGYFLIKNAGWRVLFANNNDFTNWGVFSESQLILADIPVSSGRGSINIPGNWTISHVTRSSGGTSVPEPATAFLLGIGLIGLAAVGRKKFFKK